ncbi:MAG: XrtA/PEP-CTERM system exopolysaccharide export protein [Pseudomonadota bacterium]
MKRTTMRGQIGFVVLVFLMVGCASNRGEVALGSDISGFVDEYLIGTGDVLNVNVWRHEDLSLTVPVRPDGKITMPLVGDIAVGNKTPESVGAEIKETLGEFIREPEVQVIVVQMGGDQYRSRVRVTGAVNRPLSAPFRQGMTVLDAVLEAGGASEFASLGRATLYRSSGERVKLDLRGILNKGDMRTNFVLAPGDVITIPERAF